MPLLNRKKGSRTIQPFVKKIQDDLLPKLADYGVKVEPPPISNNLTNISYSGDANNQRVTITFYSNSSQLQDYDIKEPIVFANVTYGSGGEAAGILNLNDIDDCVIKIIHTLNDLGYTEKEEKEQTINEPKTQTNNDNTKQPPSQKQELNYSKPSNKENEPDFNSNDEKENFDSDFELSIKEADVLFDGYLNKMISNNMIGANLFATILMNTGKILQIDAVYINNNTCNVETSGINPKINKETTWDRAKNYMLNVANKVHGIIEISAVDSDGADINIEEPNDDLNIDIDI